MPAAVTVDLTKLMKRFSAKELEAKQVKFAMSVAEDMNAFTPEDTKRMHNSMQAASDFRRGLVIWDADYAAYVRDLPDSSIKHSKNPRAKADWPKAREGSARRGLGAPGRRPPDRGGVTWPRT